MNNLINNKNIKILLFFFCICNLYSATCPTMYCPQSRDTPVAIYRFENNLLDSSGHNLHAYVPGDCEVSYHLNVGGREGYCVSNYYPGYGGCAINIPACVIYRAEGEIDWYQYVTISSQTTFSPCSLHWCNSSCELGLFVVYTENTISSPNSIRFSYSYADGSNIEKETQISECLVFNQWQHIQVQWGTFGVRLLVDGIVRMGSYHQWYQWARDGDSVLIGNCGYSSLQDFFYGYIDDLIFWPCSSRGTPTNTSTYTITKTFTPTFTSTFSHTFTITETSTITSTFTITETFTITFTYSETFTETHTFTSTDTFTTTPTMTITPTITPTIHVTMTFTPYLQPDKLLVKGIYPNPVIGKYGYIIFVTKDFCKVSCFIYSVSGELVNNINFDAAPGYNKIKIPTVNQSNRSLSSGTYIYHLKFTFANESMDEIWDKFVIIRKM